MNTSHLSGIPISLMFTAPQPGELQISQPQQDQLSLLGAGAMSVVQGGKIQQPTASGPYAAPTFNLACSAGLPVHSSFMPQACMPMLALQPVCAPSQEAVGLAGRTTVFFAGILPTATTHELTTLFSSFGVLVGGVNLFKPYKGSIMSKGCGLVTYATHQEAAAAMDNLHGKFMWPGARSPIVIEWMDPSKQRRKAGGQPQRHHAGQPAASNLHSLQLRQQQAVNHQPAVVRNYMFGHVGQRPM